MTDHLENTPEFNRGFHKVVADLNGASIDPRVPNPPVTRNNVEFQGEYIDPEWQREIEECVYRPFQEIIPDERQGFDTDGNWHATFTEQTAVESLGRALTPYRWAAYLQDALEQYIAPMDYRFGMSECWDIVQDIVADRMERAATHEERINLEDAMQLWYTTYRENSL